MFRPKNAKAIVGEAHKRITVAADYARDEQIGVAFMRLIEFAQRHSVSTQLAAFPPPARSFLIRDCTSL